MSIVPCRQRIVVAALLGFIALLLSVPLGLQAQDAIGQSTPVPPDEPAFTGVLLLQQQPGALDAYRDTPFVPGELLVGFYNGDTRALQQLNQEVQAAAVETLDLRGLDGATGTGNVVGQRIRVPVGEEWAVMERLLADPTVAFAVPNWLVYAAEDNNFSGPSGEPVAAPEVPFPINDPLYDSEQWYLQRINASHAWALAYADDGFGGAFTEVQVAIVDSGV
ncbi:MAG: hypothetical protein KDE53_31065, partial [Caldilineaceae bacterium]|nr:hypothetical protein [Caldilineaceae bacterium]